MTIVDITETQVERFEDVLSEDPTVENVITRCLERSNAGIEKYGQTIRDNNDKTLVEWVDDVQEELWDAMVYLEKLKEKIREYGLGNFK